MTPVYRGRAALARTIQPVEGGRKLRTNSVRLQPWGLLAWAVVGLLGLLAMWRW